MDRWGFKEFLLRSCDITRPQTHNLPIMTTPLLQGICCGNLFCLLFRAAGGQNWPQGNLDLIFY